ncbi:MAG: NDP-sugar synthase [bacterium]
MKAIIIAGGLGTRLRPLTDNVPKPIVPIVNKPFLIHQVEHLIAHGVTEVIVNLHYLSEEIKKLMGDGSRWGIKIFYSIEESPLGTAGAVKNAEQFFGTDPMIICNADVLTDLNISALVNFHHEKKAVVTLTLKEVEDPTAFGLVVMDKTGRVTKFLEKPGWDIINQEKSRTINAGTYVCNPSIFAYVPKGKRFMFEHDLYPLLLEKGEPIFGYISDSYWLDIGNPEKYKEAHEAVLRKAVSVKIEGAKLDDKIWLGEGCQIDESAKLPGPVVLGNKVKVGRGSELRDYVTVGDNVQIGHHCCLDRVIIWADCRIENNVRLSDCIIGKGCVIEDNVVIEHGAVLADGSIVKKGSKISA